MIGPIWNLLVVPELFFRERRETSLTWFAVGAIVLVELLFLAGVYAIVSAAARTSGPGFADELRTHVSATELLPALLVTAIAWWGILSLVGYLLVRNRSEHATYLRTFSTIGLAALVEIPAVLVGVLDVWLLFESTAFFDHEAAVPYLETARFGTGAASTFVWIGVTAWKGYIWREGLKGRYGISTDRATLVAGTLVLLSALPILGAVLVL